MFDKTYFESILDSHFQKIGTTSVSVAIQTRSGDIYDVSSFVETSDNVVLVRIYPPKGTERVPRILEGSDKSIPDHVALPYGEIVELYFTISTPERRTIGFGQTERTA